MGVFFDWQPQAEAIVKGSHLSDDERRTTRCLLVDARHRVIASSDGQGVLTEIVPLDTGNKKGGFTQKDNKITGFALTPGYETYRGLGWYGVVVQDIGSGAA
jgi:hypothetical protein